MEKFSVVIPTMWFSSKIIEIIRIFDSSIFVDDIILIDNNPSLSTNLSNYTKVRHIKNKENIFVNPAWNMGVRLTKNNNIIISNDDLILNDIDKILNNNEWFKYDLVGLDYKNINKNNGLKFRHPEPNMERGFGCFFYIKKITYPQIPEEMKIWCGDKFLFKKIKNKSVFSCDNIDIELSKTVKKIKDVQSILEQDRIFFSKLKI